MVKDKTEGVFRKAVKGMCSMTLVVFLFLVVFYLFPRLMIAATVIMSIPFIWRRILWTKQI